MEPIDFKELIKQEPDFAAFAKDAIFAGMIVTSELFIKSLYSFYLIGMTSEQTAQWMITNAKLNKTDK